MHRTSQYVLKRIQEAKKERLKELDLSWESWRSSDEKLTTIPVEVYALQHVEVLNLCNNSLTSVPSGIAYLKNLRSLDLSHNQIMSFPVEIAELQQLTSLNLSYNKLATLPSSLAYFKNLTKLNLYYNELTSIPDAIAALKNLTWLDLSRNKLVNLPDSIGHLSILKELNLSQNRLITLPNSIALFNSLVHLNLGCNYLTKLPDSISQLNNLEELIIEENPIKVPPLEISVKGIQAIKNYFEQFRTVGIDYLYEAKLLIVGEPGAGKTTLAKKIEDPAYRLQHNEISTEGIDVFQWEFPLPKDIQERQEFKTSPKTFRVNIWDFGGQAIYHATHQFFLTKRSLYSLVTDTRREDTDFYYWLNIVELLSNKSPILIIKNEKQNRHREINERQLREQFISLKETLATNLATGCGLAEVLDKIKHYICHLPHIGDPVPKTWVEVRSVLENDPRNYISFDEYSHTCYQKGITNDDHILQLSGYLHDLGVCLHFQQDPLLRKTLILKPSWGTDAVYKVLDNQQIIRNYGEFTRSDLTKIWSENKYSKMQDELLRLMMNFQLCYQISDSQERYLAPQLLTENKPLYKWEDKNNLIVRYTYMFMPSGILTRFIVVMHRYIADPQAVWKSGVILHGDQTFAEVIEHQDKRELRIRVSGQNKRDLMTIVTHELDKIHDSYHQLKYSKQIPCNCKKCRNMQEPHFYRYKVLRKFMADRQDKIQCEESYQMVSIKGLIDDLQTERKYVEDFNDITHLTLQKKIIDFLSSLPNIHDNDSQRALIFQAGIDSELYDQIHFGIPLLQFFSLLVSNLFDYGILKDGRHAMTAVLEAAKSQVGQDKQVVCDFLLQEIESMKHRGE